MKKYLFSLIALSMVISATCQESVSIDQEKEAIIDLLENETNAWLKGDYERWSNSYIQDESNIRLDVGSSHCDLQYGWNEINSYLKVFIVSNVRNPGSIKLGDTSLISKLFFALQNPTFFSVGFAVRDSSHNEHFLSGQS